VLRKDRDIGGKMRRIYERIRKLFYEDGMSPSAIDAEMRLASGTAHGVIVGYWVYERDSAV